MLRKLWIVAAVVAFYAAGDRAKTIKGGGFTYNCLLSCCPTLSILGKELSELLDEPEEWRWCDYGMYRRGGIIVGPICYPSTSIISFYKDGQLIDSGLGAEELEWLQIKAHSVLGKK